MSDYTAGIEEIKAIYATHAGLPVSDALKAFSRWFHRAQERARADERERIARRLSVEHAKAARNIKTRYGQGQIDAYADAARIARAGGDD